MRFSPQKQRDRWRSAQDSMCSTRFDALAKRNGAKDIPDYSTSLAPSSNWKLSSVAGHEDDKLAENVQIARPRENHRWSSDFKYSDESITFHGTMTAIERLQLPSPPEHLLRQASLFLDFDGTLVEIASRPDAVRVGLRLQHLMSSLSMKLNRRVAIVSGRSAQQIHDLFGQPTFAISGSHGIELRWPNGETVTATVNDQHEIVLAEMKNFERAHAGIFVEKKPFGVALHYRLAPHMENECWQLAERIAAQTGYSPQAGKMVVELVIPGTNKGRAVQAFMGMPPMAGTRPVFVGDDDTDESGFLVAKQLGGVGVLVGAHRPTAATFGLASVDETLRWLEIASEFAS